jgi:6-phosphogluconolactonase (cycloisomerase 2 family)
MMQDTFTTRTLRSLRRLLPLIAAVAVGCSSDSTEPTAPPTLSGISTDTFIQGTSTTVTVTGTNFVPGATSVLISGDGVTIGNVSLASTTSMTVTVAVAADATPGPRTITVKTASGTSATIPFTVKIPAPTLSAISPATGRVGATVPITLTGTGFVAGATTIAASSADIIVQNVSVSSATSLTASLVIDANAVLGARSISVATAGGTSGAQTFAVIPLPPTLASLSAASGVVGTSVTQTLTGANFVAGATVAVSGSGVTVSDVSVQSATSLTARFTIASDAALGGRSVSVTTAGGTTTAAAFAINPPAPTITLVSPATGARGLSTSVTIIGTNFVTTGTTLSLSGTGVSVASVAVASPTSIVAVLTVDVAAPLGARTLSVTTAGGSAAASFSVLPPAPILSFVTPKNLPQGFRGAITVTGANFTSGSFVEISGAGVTTGDQLVVSEISMSVALTIDANAPLGWRQVKVTTPGGVATGDSVQIVLAAPFLASITPSSGGLGVTVPVTLAGENFRTGATISVSGTGVTAGAVTVASSTSIQSTLIVAPGATLGARSVSVATAGGVSNSLSFTVAGTAPTLATVTPAVGAQSALVTTTLTGTNFVAGGTSVAVSGTGVTASNVNVTSGTSLTADLTISPTAALGARNLTVNTSAGPSGAQTFTVNPPVPTLTAVTPNTGAQNGSQTVTLTGTSFVTGATTVNVSGAGVTVSNVNVTSGTSLTATFDVAVGAALGAGTVSVTTAGGTSGTQAFTVIVGPSITSFAALSTHVTIVQPVTVAWTTANATSCSILPTFFARPCTGSGIVTPGTNTTYTLTASNAGASVNASSTVFVNEPGRWVYSSANGNNQLRQWSLDPTTGDLTAIGGGTVGTAAGPAGVAADPNGRYVYAADNVAGRVSQFSINSTTGALTAIGGGSVVAGAGPLSIAVDPTGRFVYVLNNNSGGAGSISAYTIDGTGALVANGTSAVGNSAQDLTIDPLARFVYVTNRNDASISMFRINADGTLAANGTTTGVTKANGIAADPSGRFVYVTQRAVTGLTSNVAAFAINSDGTLTATGVLVATGTMDHLAVDPTGRFVYAPDLNNAIMHEYSINQTTGVLTEFASIGTAQGVVVGTDRITVDPQGKFVYTANSFGANSVSIFAINQTTGALTLANTIAAGSNPLGIAVSR